MTAAFQISLTYVQVICVSNDYVYCMSKNINANDTEFPRSVTLDSNFIQSKKVSKLKYIFHSRVWVELHIYFNIRGHFLADTQPRSMRLFLIPH